MTSKEARRRRRREKRAVARRVAHIRRQASQEENPDRAYGMLKAADYLEETGSPSAAIAKARAEAEAQRIADRKHLPGLPVSGNVADENKLPYFPAHAEVHIHE